MNISTWAAMQPIDVLEQVERMIPDIVSEKEFEDLRRRRDHHKLRQGHSKGRSKEKGFSFWKAVGALLVMIGLMMLFPGPSDIAAAGAGFSVGIMLGWGLKASMILGGVFVIATFFVALLIIAIGSWLITVG